MLYQPASRLFAGVIAVMTVLLHSCSMPEKPVTREEGAAFASRIEKSAEKQNAVLLDNIFDEDAFSKRVADASNKPLNKSMKQGAIEGIHSAQFGQQIMKAIGGSGSYKLVKQYEKEGHQHLLFRLYGDGAINYHDYELVKKEESIKAADIYIYLSGENLSKTLADALMMMQSSMPDMSQKDLDKVNKIKTIKSLVAQKDYEKASRTYDELPADFKKQKLFQLIHIQIGSGMGNDKYAEAMSEYKSLFPSDPNMYLMMIDAYVLQKDYPRALESVNKLDSIIDKDPFLDYYRGLMYKLMQDTAKTKETFERLYAKMPMFSGGPIELITVYIKTGEMSKAVDVMKRSIVDKTLNQASIDGLYALHPGLQKAVEAAE